MKKFLYVAVMALTLGFMASCSGNSSSYKQGDPQPSIDREKSTVNGIYYDNKTEKCWKVTQKQTVLGVSKTAEVYIWGTEFDLKSTEETWMWTTAQVGAASTASYSYVVTTDKDYESCIKHNEDK